jgi:hypothetical protein
VAKLEGRRSHGIPRGRWENNNITELKETKWKGVDWIDLRQNMEY